MIEALEWGVWWFLVYSIWLQHIPYDYYSKERNFSFGHDSRHFRYIVVVVVTGHCAFFFMLLHPFSIVTLVIFYSGTVVVLLMMPPSPPSPPLCHHYPPFLQILMLLLSFRSNDHILFRKCKSNVSAQAQPQLDPDPGA